MKTAAKMVLRRMGRSRVVYVMYPRGQRVVSYTTPVTLKTGDRIVFRPVSHTHPIEPQDGSGA